jgi:hypothetical protein
MHLLGHGCWKRLLGTLSVRTWRGVWGGGCRHCTVACQRGIKRWTVSQFRKQCLFDSTDEIAVSWDSVPEKGRRAGRNRNGNALIPK